MRYLCYIDTETTCLPEQESGNILIQLAFAIFDTEKNEFYQVSESLCKNEYPLTSKAMMMHGITPEMLKNELQIEDTETYRLLEAFIESHHHESVLVAHNLPFDFDVLSRVIDFKTMRQLDTLKVMRMINDQLGLPYESCALQFLKYELKLYQKVHALCEIIGITKHLSAHDAMSDIIDLILLVNYIRATFNADIKQMVKITESGPLYLTYMPSGKDKGVKLVDLTYNQLQWHAENSYDEHVRFTCNQILS